MDEITRVGRRLRPGQRLSHVSAARWLRMPLPWGVSDVVHVTSGPKAAQVRRRGTVGHRDDGEHAILVRSVRVTAPERLFVELATIIGVDALIAAGDFLVHAPRFGEPGRPWTSVERLHDFNREHHWGSPNARLALPQVRTGVESAMETGLRLLLARAGLPEPVCGYELLDARGQRVGWFDLAWPTARVLGEYDGDQHRTSTMQYERDIRRFDLAADMGWRTIRVRSAGLRRAGRADTVARFRRALGG